MKTSVMLLVFAVAAVCYTQEKYLVGEGTTAGIMNTFTRVNPPSIYADRVELNTNPTSTFNVHFASDFPSTARPAFLRAAEIWSYLINSQQLIGIQAEWNPLGQGILAQTHPDSMYKNFPSAPKQNILYPTALAEALSNQNLNGRDTAIIIEVDSNQTNWYYGTDGNTPAGKYDLVAVIHHEIAHGLGYDHSFRVQGLIGSWGNQVPTGFATIYDDADIVGNNHGTSIYRLTNTSTYPNPSQLLGDQLKGDNVYFDGLNVFRINNNSLAKLYAPSAWSGGSSISHLDESTYPPGNSNSLMTPQTDLAEAVHSPGEIGLAILQDLGWTINRVITITKPTAGTIWQQGQADTIWWTDNRYPSGIVTIQLWKRNLSGSYNYYSDIAVVNSSQGRNHYPWSARVDTGTYRIKMLNESEGYGMSSAFAILNIPQVAAPVFSPPAGQYATAQSCTLTTATSGAEIRYTTNGSDPTPTSTLYTGPISVNTSVALKARGYKAGYNPSVISTAVYVIGTVPDPPQISPSSGTYPVPFTVYFNWPAGTACFLSYTTDGSEPIDPVIGGYQIFYTSWTWPYPGYTVRMKLRSYFNGQWSSLTSATYIAVPGLRIAQIDASYPSYFSGFGTWGRWETNQWRYYPDTTFYRASGPTTFTLRASQDYYGQSNKKYHQWRLNDNPTLTHIANHADIPIDQNTSEALARFVISNSTVTVKTDLVDVPGTTGGYIQFRDPWYIDSLDVAKNNTWRNRGVTAVYHDRSVATNGFKPDSTTIYPEGPYPYRGVFLNQGFAGPNPVYYSVGAPSQQIGNFTYNFANWKVTQGVAAFQNPNAAQTGVVFQSANTTVAARMKAPLASSSPSALSTNQQRKFSRWREINTWNGYKFLYESGGLIWEVRSTDMGATWQPEQLLSTNPGTHQAPSLAIATSFFGVPNSHDIVWHTNASGADQIWYRLWTSPPRMIGNLIAHPSISPAPVIARRTGVYQLLASYTRANGIDVMKSSDNGGSWVRDDVSDSLNNRYRPSLGSAGGNVVYLAYDDGNRAYFDFYYRHSIGIDSYIEGWWRVLGGQEEVIPGSISSRTGFKGNAQVVSMSTSTIGFGKVGVVWEMQEGMRIEATPQEEQMELEVQDETGIAVMPIEYSVCFQSNNLGLTGWGLRQKFVGNNFRTPSISYVTNNKLLWMWRNAQYIITSQSTNDGATWSTPIRLHAGVDPQPVLGAGEPSQPIEYVYRSLSGPIYRVGPYSGIPQQEVVVADATREMIVADGSSEASLTVEMASLSLKTSSTISEIPFAVGEDSAFAASVNNVEQYLGAAPYTIPQDADSIYLRIRMSSKRASDLTLGNAPLRVRVQYTVDGSNRRTAAQWRFAGDHTLNKTFRLRARPLRGKQVQFEVSVLGLNRNNSNLRASVASVVRSTSPIAPGNNIALQGREEIPQTFGLEQNYPNPFNPTTAIRFQLPADAHVLLKLYDVLGQEVSTLVNEAKSAGYYEVTLDASALASGLYLYKMLAGDFIAVRKLLVIK